MSSFAFHHYHHVDSDGEISAKLDKMALSISNLKELIIMNAQELASTAVELKEGLTKVFAEVANFKAAAAANQEALQSAIASLEAEILSNGTVSETTAADFAEAKRLLGLTDQLIDDLPAAPVVEG